MRDEARARCRAPSRRPPRRARGARASPSRRPPAAGSGARPRSPSRRQASRRRARCAPQHQRPRDRDGERRGLEDRRHVGDGHPARAPRGRSRPSPVSASARSPMSRPVAPPDARHADPRARPSRPGPGHPVPRSAIAWNSGIWLPSAFMQASDTAKAAIPAVIVAAARKLSGRHMGVGYQRRRPGARPPRGAASAHRRLGRASRWLTPRVSATCRRPSMRQSPPCAREP